jgi:uncharacterized protein YlxW (UPF0749 family)
MNFQVIGDEVFYRGDRVAVLVVGHSAAVVRQEVEDELQNEEDLDSLRQELAELESKYDDLDSNFGDEREELEAKIQAAIDQRDAYAAILGVTP